MCICMWITFFKQKIIFSSFLKITENPYFLKILLDIVILLNYNQLAVFTIGNCASTAVKVKKNCFIILLIVAAG